MSLEEYPYKSNQTVFKHAWNSFYWGSDILHFIQTFTIDCRKKERNVQDWRIFHFVYTIRKSIFLVVFRRIQLDVWCDISLYKFNRNCSTAVINNLCLFFCLVFFIYLYVILIWKVAARLSDLMRVTKPSRINRLHPNTWYITAVINGNDKRLICSYDPISIVGAGSGTILVRELDLILIIDKLYFVKRLLQNLVFMRLM